MKLPLSTARIGLVVAGMLGTAGAVAMATAGADGTPANSFRPASSSDDGPGDVNGPCDEAEHADDPRCVGVTAPGPTAPTSTTMGTSPAPAPAPAASGAHTLPTPGGTVAYTVDGATLHLVSAVPAAGWTVEVEQGTGREIELDFRSGTQRVQVNVELEDGHARERVRLRDDADGTDDRVDDHGGDVSSGHGSDDSGPDDSDHSGSDD